MRTCTTPHLICNSREPNGPCPLIQRKRSRTKDLRHSSFSESSFHLHLEHTVLRFGITQTEPCISLGGSMNMRNGKLIAIYIDGAVDSRYLCRAIIRWHRTRHKMNAEHDQSYR